MKTACFTGHRPNKLGGYGNNPKAQALKKALEEEIKKAIAQGFTTFISGGALGVDQWAAQIVINLKKDNPGIKLVMAKPFPSQDKIWPEESRKYFQSLCDQCEEVVNVSEDPFTNWKMQVRNEYMINRSDLVIAIYDGTSGGTGNAVKYAKKKEKSLVVINPNDY